MLLTEHDVMGYLASFFWPFVRLTGVFLSAPILGNNLLPVLSRVLLIAGLAGCLAAWGGPWPPLPSTMVGLMLAATIGISFGFMLGLVGLIVVSAVASAGEVAGSALGLNFATTAGIASPGVAPVLYDVFQWASWLVYLGLGGPFWIMEAVSKSFHSLPAGIPNLAALASLFEYSGALLRDAVLLALPALAAGLAVNIVIAIANALSSQLNIFSIGFPLLFLGGIWVLASSLFFVEPVAVELMQQGAAVLAALAHG
jgi:flagellar biosynthesis protein FliR